jgi:tripartite ATP-independent transporter DctM subunit
MPQILFNRFFWLVRSAAALLLALDLLVVIYSVIARSVFSSPLDWADDVARGLMVASAFFGSACAIEEGENPGLVFFVHKCSTGVRNLFESLAALLVCVVAAYVSFNALDMSLMTIGQTTGSGLPLQLTFFPMGIGALTMTIFSLRKFTDKGLVVNLSSLIILCCVYAVYLIWSQYFPNTLPSPQFLMSMAFFVTLLAGVPIGFVLAICALIFNFTDGSIPGVIFAQQMARGVDNFVLLAIPFFILVGYLMEANGMSVRLIELLQVLIGRTKGGLNVVMVSAMVLFSGISGSKMADVAAVGSVLIPAARKSGQKPGNAVALLAASAVMAETIPPCINLIILGFVANISIGGLFAAGLLPAALMAITLVIFSIVFGTKSIDIVIQPRDINQKIRMWLGSLISFGLIFMIFVGFKTGFATATEVSAFAALYAIVIGSLVFREMSWKSLYNCFVNSASRAGLVLFIVSTAQTLAFTLTLQQIPHELGEFLVSVSHSHGIWAFLFLSIAILIFMGSVLEGAAALIIFGPLLVPVAIRLGLSPLHFGVVLVISMGIGLFAPPLGLGLYGACLVGKVPVEETVKPIMGYLGLLLACLFVIALLPEISLYLPKYFGY